MSWKQPLFEDRTDAGRQLADRLSQLATDNPIILALPRGGVPVASEVAVALNAPLDVIVVRKIGVPSHPELAMGALGEQGITVTNHDVITAAGVTTEQWQRVVENERVELDRRAGAYRTGDEPLNLEGRQVVIVDDGIATGSTARAAGQVARALGSAQVVLAIPVAPRESLAALRDAFDDMFAVATPHPFRAIGMFYEDFTQTSDDEVIRLLRGD